ncbi:MAG: LEPR-XLL domain-containing protein, partial [Burkholderiaceae bacterium]|nr:LEPR-XLL domain-containing protein [Burkholderiaceae bacterium]
MSIKNLRARAAAALRRSSTASVEVKRQTKVPHATGAAAQAPQWRIESLEPKLLLSADALPGIASIEGSIDQPGEQDRYEFVVTDPTKLFFDGIDGAQVQWQLRQGQSTLFDNRDIGAVGDRFLALQPGTYQLNVDGVGDALSAYKFRLIGEDAATLMQANTAITGQLQGAQAMLYSVQAQMGDRLFFQTNPGSSNLRWTLFDPAATIVSGTNGWGDGGAFVATRSGSYSLSIEALAGSSSTDFGFTLFRNAPQLTALEFGQDYQADLSSPGASAQYRFTLSDTTLVAWDQLSAAAAGLRWSLTNSSGTVQGTAQVDGQDVSTAPLLLAAGSYTLTLEGQARNTGSVRFRLLSSVGAAALPDHTDLAVDAANSRASQVVRIDAAAAGSLAIAYRDGRTTGATLASAIELLTDGSTTAQTGVTLGGNAAGDADVRLYTVAGLAGEQLLMTVSSLGLEAGLRLFNASGQEVAAVVGDTLRYSVASAGIYYVGVSRAANAAYVPTEVPAAGMAVDAASLRLSVTRVGAAEVSVVASGGDVADTLNTAVPLLLPRGGSVTLPITIGDGAYAGRDVDMFRTVLQAGEVLRCTTPNGTLDGYLRVFDAAGRYVAGVDDSPLTWTVPTSGIYYLGFSAYPNYNYDPATPGSGNSGGTGTMSVTVSRDAGTTSSGTAWRITDALGNTLASGGLASDQTIVAALPKAGSYFLWTYRDLAATAASAFEVDRWADPVVTASTWGASSATVVPGDALTARQVRTVEVTVPASGLWFVEPKGADNGQWQLVGPQGTVADWQAFTETRGAGASALYLPAGSYQLRVRQTARPFTVTATPAAASGLLTAGSAVSLAGLAVGQSALWHTAAARQDVFQLAGAVDGEFETAASDAYGRLLWRGRDALAQFHQGDAAGDVWLRVTRLKSLSAVPTVTLNRTPANLPADGGTPIVLDALVAVTANGSTQRFEFDLAADGLLGVEWQGDADQTWQLRGPRGVEASGSLTSALTSGRWTLPTQWLPAGHYVLTLDTPQHDARFTLRTLGSAQPVAVNTAVASDLAADDAFGLFDLALRADTDLWLRPGSGMGTGDVYRLYDAAGRVVAQGDPAQANAGAFTVPRDGHYLLAVARNTGATLGGGALRFTLYETPRHAVLAEGATQGRFTTGSQSFDYAFNVNSSVQLAVRETANGGSRNSYEVYDSAGRLVTRLNYSDSYTDAIWALSPGSYTLRARYPSSSTPAAPSAFAFNARFIQPATQSWAVGSTASVTWSAGAPDRELQLNLAARESRWISASAALDYYDRIDYRVIDSLGAEVARGLMSGGYWGAIQGFAIAAGSAGTYTVQLSGSNVSSGRSMSGSTALLQSAGSRSIQPLLLGTAVDASLATPADQAVYRFTLTDPTRLWLNVSGDYYTATLVRTDVPGTVFSQSLDGDDRTGVQDLLAGSYELRLTPNRSAPGSFHVLAMPVTALPSLSLGQLATQTVALSRQGAAWQLVGTAGQTL